jgi:hypothetical protein
MAEEFTLLGFATLTTHLVARVEHSKHEALEEGAKIIEEEAKRVVGTYDYGWPELAVNTGGSRKTRICGRRAVAKDGRATRFD